MIPPPSTSDFGGTCGGYSISPASGAVLGAWRASGSGNPCVNCSCRTSWMILARLVEFEDQLRNELNVQEIRFFGTADTSPVEPVSPDSYVVAAECTLIVALDTVIT